MAVLVDGRVVSVSDENKLRVWNLTTGVCDVVLKGHTRVSIALYVCSRARARIC